MRKQNERCEGGVSGMQEESCFTLRDYIEIIKKRKLLIILITTISVILAGVINYVTPATYEAETSVVIGKTDFDNDSQAQSDILMYQNLVTTYAKIAQSINVADETASELHNNSTYSNITADDISNALTVNPEKNTQIIDISIRSNNAEQAKIIANVLTDSFMTEAKRIYPTQDIQIMDAARMPKSPILPDKKKNYVIAFMLGLGISIGLAILLEKTDNTIKNEMDAEKCLELPVLGIIPYTKITKN